MNGNFPIYTRAHVYPGLGEPRVALAPARHGPPGAGPGFCDSQSRAYMAAIPAGGRRVMNASNRNRYRDGAYDDDGEGPRDFDGRLLPRAVP